MLAIEQDEFSQSTSTKRAKSAMALLEEFVKKHREEREEGGASSLFEFEKKLHEKLMAIEREFVAEELARADVDVAAIEIEGIVYRKVLRSIGSYQTAAGEVKVERSLYKNRSRDSDDERSLVPMALRLGLIEKRWTPLAAQQATWVVTQMTPGRGEELLELIGNMTPSKSSLDRLPKALGAEWEGDREALEESLLASECVPNETVTVAVSLDGVMAPMRERKGAERREKSADEGKLTRGPYGYREVGCATLSFYDAAGKMLRAVRFARMPEAKKVTLKSIIIYELGRVPELSVVAVADGAKDNWTFLNDEILEKLPDTTQKLGVLDFYHGAEHLSAALGAAYGEGTVKARAMFEKHRRVLLDDHQGVEKVIRALAGLSKRHPQSEKLKVVLTYFRSNRHRMHYADYSAVGVPIGSGVIDAACKTLVTQRMKNSGMSWGADGGQAILTMRGWTQSDRFDRAWALLAARYKVEGHVIADVIDINSMR